MLARSPFSSPFLIQYTRLVGCPRLSLHSILLIGDHFHYIKNRPTNRTQSDKNSDKGFLLLSKKGKEGLP